MNRLKKQVKRFASNNCLNAGKGKWDGKMDILRLVGANKRDTFSAFVQCGIIALVFAGYAMRQILLSVLIVHLAACSSMQTVPVRDLQNQGETASLQIGDRIELTTHNDEKLDFAVTDITPDGLAGKFGFIPYDDIRRVRVHRPGQSNGQNMTWLWGILGVAALIGLLSAADSVTACSGTPCPQPNPN